MQHGTAFLIALVFAMVFFAWPRHRPAPRKIAPERKPSQRPGNKP
jgi:hypothetical protein